MNRKPVRIVYTVVASLVLFATAKATAGIQPAPGAAPANAAGPGGFMILVNAENPLPERYVVKTAQADDTTGKKLQRVAAAQYRAMAAAAQKDGVQLTLCSGYRSLEYQRRLYQKKVRFFLDRGLDADQAGKQAATVVAPPGCSEHNTGLAADIVTPSHQALDAAFDQTEAFAWLQKHCAEYGFILRYPQGKESCTGIIYEPWHYRFVGREAAEKITASGLCLEEYLAQNAE